MLDLSNNNAMGHDFKKAYAKGGQRRVYLKRCQGVTFVDTTYPTLRRSALAAKIKVGAYDYLEPLKSTPAEAAQYLLKLIGTPLVRDRDLRPALDCEYKKPSEQVGKWIADTARIVTRETGVKPLIYGSGWWLQDCAFRSVPGPLWLAAYGRDDGREYPIDKLPSPWKALAAHQYTSKGQVVGINGKCDVSHVFLPGSIEVPKQLAL